MLWLRFNFSRGISIDNFFENPVIKSGLLPKSKQVFWSCFVKFIIQIKNACQGLEGSFKNESSPPWIMFETLNPLWGPLSPRCFQEAVKDLLEVNEYFVSAHLCWPFLGETWKHKRVCWDFSMISLPVRLVRLNQNLRLFCFSERGRVKRSGSQVEF